MEGERGREGDEVDYRLRIRLGYRRRAEVNGRNGAEDIMLPALSHLLKTLQNHSQPAIQPVVARLYKCRTR